MTIAGVKGASATSTGPSFAIPTARGDTIDSGDLGFTLPVEDTIQESPEMALNWPDYSWAARPEEERIAGVVAKLKVAKQTGVDSIVDRTIPGVGRNVPRLKKIAEQTQLNIIVLTGWYVRYEFEYYFHYRERFPDWYKGELTYEDFLARDIEEGILDTGVRAAGIKVVSDCYGIRETGDVRNVFRHAARVHRRNGAPLMTHTTGVNGAMIQQEVFAEDGVDLSRVLLGHIDRTPADVPLGDFERLLQKGSFLSFDGWWGTGEPHPVRSYAATREQNIDRVVSLIERGYEKQLLLSNGNVAFADCLPDLEGEDFAPYTQLHLDIIPALRDGGITDAQIAQMTVENPRRVFESLARGGY
jgi:phosphotriesterase-related protein